MSIKPEAGELGKVFVSVVLSFLFGSTAVLFAAAQKLETRDVCAASADYDAAKRGLTRLGNELGQRPDSGGWDLAAALAAVSFAKQPPSTPEGAPAPSSLGEVERQIQVAKQKLDDKRQEISRKEREYRATHGKLPRDRLDELWQKPEYKRQIDDFDRSPEWIAQRITAREGLLAEAKRDLVELGREKQPESTNPFPSVRWEDQELGVRWEELSPAEQLFHLENSNTEAYQVHVPRRFVDQGFVGSRDESGALVDGGEIERLLSFNYYTDDSLKSIRDRLVGNVEAVRKDPEKLGELFIHSQRIREDARKLIEGIKRKQAARKDELQKATAELKKAMESRQTPSREEKTKRAGLEKRVEELGQEVDRYRVWLAASRDQQKFKALEDDRAPLERIWENWTHYQDRHQKWTKAKDAVAEWNQARVGWAKVRESKDQLAAQAQALLEAGTTLDGEKDVITKEVVEEERQTAEKLCRKLTEKIKAYRRSTTKDPKLGAQLKKAKGRYQKLYGDFQGWKERQSVREEIQNKMREAVETKATKLSSLAEELEVYRCVEGASALARKLASRAQKLGQDVGRAHVVLPDLRLVGSCELGEVPVTRKVRLDSVVLMVREGTHGEWKETKLGAQASGSIPLVFDKKTKSGDRMLALQGKGTFRYDLPAEFDNRQQTQLYQAALEVTFTNSGWPPSSGNKASLTLLDVNNRYGGGYKNEDHDMHGSMSWTKRFSIERNMVVRNGKVSFTWSAWSGRTAFNDSMYYQLHFYYQKGPVGQ